MVPTKTVSMKIPALESLQLAKIQEILGPPGPCLTLLLPPYRPGEPAKSAAAQIKTNLKNAARLMAEAKVPEAVISEIVEPLHHLSEDPTLPGGSHWGRAIFRSRRVFRQFQFSAVGAATTTVAGCFAIRPLLADLQLPQEFYLLMLSKENIGLMRSTDLRAEPVALPKGVPETLAEAMEFEPPDHDLENRAASGGGMGALRGVRFGTGSGRETQHAHLADFYKLVDRGLHKFLHAKGDASLVLVGVDEDTSSYRAINTYPNLIAGSVHGSPGAFDNESVLLHDAFAAIREEFVAREARTLVQSRERLGPARFSTDPATVIHAAFAGRVDRVYIGETGRWDGVFEKEGYRSCGEEDLLNLGAVQSILHGGRAFVLPASKMPGGASIAASLRFPIAT